MIKTIKSVLIKFNYVTVCNFELSIKYNRHELCLTNLRKYNKISNSVNTVLHICNLIQK